MRRSYSPIGRSSWRRLPCAPPTLRFKSLLLSTACVEHRAAVADHELRWARVFETERLPDVDMAGDREREARRQLAVPGASAACSVAFSWSPLCLKPQTGRWLTSHAPSGGLHRGELVRIGLRAAAVFGLRRSSRGRIGLRPSMSSPPSLSTGTRRAHCSNSSMMNCWLPTVTVSGSSSAAHAGGFWSVASVGSRNSMKPVAGARCRSRDCRASRSRARRQAAARRA